MGDLTGSTISSTYNLLLTTESAVMGSSLQSIQSGTGVSSALKLSTSVVSVNGSLGVGTEDTGTAHSAYSNIVVGESSDGYSGMTFRSTTTGTSAILFTDGVSPYNQGKVIYDHDAGTMTLGAEAGDAIVIDSSNDVGIGTAVPAQNLHINNGGTGEGDHAYLLFTTGDTGSTASDGLTVGYAASNYAIINNREETDLVFATSGDNQMTITAAGNIGTANAFFLTNGGSATAGNAIYSPASNELGISTNGVEAIRIDSDGNVGIGEENPSQIVDIKGTDTTARLQVTNSDSSSLVLGYAGTTDAVLSNTAVGDFIFGTANTEAIRIDSDGNVILANVQEGDSGLASGTIYKDSGFLKIVA